MSLLNSPATIQAVQDSIREGVIKFDLVFEAGPPEVTADFLGELLAWRHILFRLGLTGRVSNLYGGLAYGNLSLKLANGGFIISGTQTGGKQQLGISDFCRVNKVDLAANRLEAVGPIRPSSEALSHAAAYSANPAIGCVIHVHSRELWKANSLGMADYISPDIAYGTAEMGLAVANVAKVKSSGLLVMQGHEDGILSFAPTVRAAALNLLTGLAESLGSL